MDPSPPTKSRDDLHSQSRKSDKNEKSIEINENKECQGNNRSDGIAKWEEEKNQTKKRRNRHLKRKSSVYGHEQLNKSRLHARRYSMENAYRRNSIEFRPERRNSLEDRLQLDESDLQQTHPQLPTTSSNHIRHGDSGVSRKSELYHLAEHHNHDDHTSDSLANFDFMAETSSTATRTKDSVTIKQNNITAKQHSSSSSTPADFATIPINMEINVTTIPPHSSSHSSMHRSNNESIEKDMMKMDLELGDVLIPVNSHHRKGQSWLRYAGCFFAVAILIGTPFVTLINKANNHGSSIDKDPPMALEDLTYTCSPEFLSTSEGRRMCERTCHNAKECCTLSPDDPSAGCRNIRDTAYEVDLCREYKERCSVLE